MHTLNFFRSAKNDPPIRSDYYLCFLEDKTMKILYYSTRNKTWTYNTIDDDPAFSKCFNHNVLAWASMDSSIYALSNREWN